MVLSSLLFSGRSVRTVLGLSRRLWCTRSSIRTWSSNGWSLDKESICASSSSSFRPALGPWTGATAARTTLFRTHTTSAVPLSEPCKKPLPKLPVPDLQQTLNKYLRCIKPLVSDAQYANTHRLVDDFGRDEGIGERLQEKLKEYAESKDNWVNNLWLDDMYLKNKLALPINSNPGILFPRMTFEDRSEQLRFAARFISGIMDYKVILDTKSLPVDRAGSREKGQPLCMDQYYHLYSTYRVPGVQKDQLVSSPTSEHIVIACKNQFFVLDMTTPSSARLSDDNIYAQLKRIVKIAEEGDDKSQRVGILTALQRDNWAKARLRLLEDPVNRESLDLIERSLFLVCLDKSMPIAFNHQKSVDDTRRNQRDDTSMAKQMLHGHGTQHNTCNRWFDKTMQFVIGADGACGLCYEHSPAEGIAVVQLIQHLLKYMEEIRLRKLPRMQSLCDLVHPRKLHWELADDTHKDIKHAMQDTNRLIDNLDLYVLRFPIFGKNVPKQNNMSPDAFMQLALQLTYYKIHGKLVSTYESASIRRFRLGRVDNIRACTSEALEWCKALVGETTTSDEEKMVLMRKAINRQTEILVQTILGHGIDNHLLGLRQMAVQMGIETPELFKDEVYQQSNSFTLSTSQIPTSMDFVTFYGPVVPDGYGACYNLQPDYIDVCVSSFISCGATLSDYFAATLESSLTQIKELCDKATVSQSDANNAPETTTPQQNGGLQDTNSSSRNGDMQKRKLTRQEVVTNPTEGTSV